MSEKMTIGADPEFGFMQEGRLVPAEGLGYGNIESGFGVDGGRKVAELRPQYGNTPLELVHNVRNQLISGVKGFPQLHELKWKAGSIAGEEPIGGHIHFGSRSLLKSDVATKTCQALNKTVAVLVMMVEDQEEALNRRIGSSYGSVTHEYYRAQEWGAEWRVLPSWLTSPKEAEAILSLSYVVAKEHDNPDVMAEAGSLPAYDSRSFQECDKIGLLYYVPPIVRFIRGLPEYPKYEQAIAPLFRMIKRQEVWSHDADMLDTWELRQYIPKAKKERAQLV